MPILEIRITQSHVRSMCALLIETSTRILDHIVVVLLKHIILAASAEQVPCSETRVCFLSDVGRGILAVVPFASGLLPIRTLLERPLRILSPFIFCKRLLLMRAGCFCSQLPLYS